ncbi:MAG: hypothetical protein LBS74_01895 [Oscillospiraceae bacterium]|jgi:uncharacterized surface anchored protein|nr:hypothetical protein [Oscillospiraceae bacterium]
MRNLFKKAVSIISVVALLVTSIPFASVTAAVGDTIAATFPDTNLAAYIASELGKSVGDEFTSGDASDTRLNKIVIPTATPVNNFTGLEYITGLTEITATTNGASVWPDLTASTTLKRLAIRGTQTTPATAPNFSSFNPAVLEVVSLPWCNLQALPTGLTSFSNLTNLDLSYNMLGKWNQIKTFSWHTAFPNLQYVGAVWAPDGITREGLDLGRNELQVVPNFAGYSFTSATAFSANLLNNMIRDIDNLSGLPADPSEAIHIWSNSSAMSPAGAALPAPYNHRPGANISSSYDKYEDADGVHIKVPYPGFNGGSVRSGINLNDVINGTVPATLASIFPEPLTIDFLHGNSAYASSGTLDGGFDLINRPIYGITPGYVDTSYEHDVLLYVRYRDIPKTPGSTTAGTASQFYVLKLRVGDGGLNSGYRSSVRPLGPLGPLEIVTQAGTVVAFCCDYFLHGSDDNFKVYEYTESDQIAAFFGISMDGLARLRYIAANSPLNTDASVDDLYAVWPHQNYTPTGDFFGPGTYPSGSTGGVPLFTATPGSLTTTTNDPAGTVNPQGYKGFPVTAPFDTSISKMILVAQQIFHYAIHLEQGGTLTTINSAFHTPTSLGSNLQPNLTAAANAAFITALYNPADTSKKITDAEMGEKFPTATITVNGADKSKNITNSSGAILGPYTIGGTDIPAGTTFSISLNNASVFVCDSAGAAASLTGYEVGDPFYIYVPAGIATGSVTITLSNPRVLAGYIEEYYYAGSTNQDAYRIKSLHKNVTTTETGSWTKESEEASYGNIDLFKKGYNKASGSISFAPDGTVTATAVIPIQGATFDVFAAEDIYDIYGDTTSKLRAANGTKVATITTGVDGHAKVTAATFLDNAGVPSGTTVGYLYPGRYRIVETSAPAGYIVDSRTFYANVTAGNNSTPVETTEIGDAPYDIATPFDDLKTKNVKLIKVEKDNPANRVEGATIAIYADNGDSDFTNDTLLYTTTTSVGGEEGVGGEIDITGLPAGNYYFKETAVPAGYILNPVPVQFTVTGNEVGTIEVTMVDVAQPHGNINLVKLSLSTDWTVTSPGPDIYVDANGNTRYVGYPIPFANATFEVKAAIDIYAYSESGVGVGPTGTKTIRARAGDVIATIVTNALGQARIDASHPAKFLEDDQTTYEYLPYLYMGTYTIQETSAPAGYQLDPRIFTVTFDPNVDAADGTGLITKPVVSNDPIQGGDNRPFNRPVWANIKLIKQEAGSSPVIKLANATVELYTNDDLLLGEFVTDVNGEITIKDLPVGTYYFLETVPPANYDLNPNKLYFTVNADGSVSTVSGPAAGGVLVLNDTKENLGNLLLHKTGYDKDTLTVVSISGNKRADYSTKVIQGAVFEVFAEENIDVIGLDGLTHRRANKDALVATITTDALGNASVVTATYKDDLGVNMTVNGLIYGKYYVKELSAPAGFKVDPRIFHIVVSATTPIPNVTTNETATYPYTSPEPFDVIPWGDVELTKRDATALTGIPGATVELYTASNILLGEFVTDTQGKVRISNLPAGSYYFIEKSVPTGSSYLLNPNQIPFTVTDGGNATPNMDEEQLNVGNLNLVKKGHSTSQNDLTISSGGAASVTAIVPVANAVFEVRAAEFIYTRKYSGTDVGAILRARTGELVATITTNSSGQATVTNASFMNELGAWETGLNFLYYGRYTVTEVSAPPAYVIDSTPITVTVSAATPNPVVQHSVNNAYSGDKDPFNRIKTRNVKLRKIDAETRAPLAGAVIGIYTIDGALKQSFTTPTNGEIDITGLPYGRYYFQEITPPYGHHLNSARVEFEVNTDGGLITLELINREMELDVSGGYLRLQKTGQNKEDFTVQPDGSVQFGTVPFKGAEFAVYAQSEIKTPDRYTPSIIRLRASKDQLITTITTDVNGYAEALVGDFYNDSGVLTGRTPLYWGTYYLIETKAPDGYELDPRPFVVQVRPPYEGYQGDPLWFDVKTTDVLTKPYTSADPFDITTKINANLKKVDSASGLAVPGATVALYWRNSKTGVYEKKLEAVTDSKGEVNITGLPIGDYYFVELDAPDPYILNTTKVNFTLTSAMGNNYTHVITLENAKPVFGNINLIKTAFNKDDFTVDNTGKTVYGSEIPFKGARFEIRAAEDIYTKVSNDPADARKILRARKGALVATVTTDNNGQASVSEAKFLDASGNSRYYTDLFLGKYVITEVFAPGDYVIDPREFTVELTSTNPSDTIVVKPVLSDTYGTYPYLAQHPFDRPAWADSELLKVDEDTRDPVAGATIALYDENDNLLYTTVTGADGKITVRQLPIGVYYFLEKVAPEGYLINNKKHWFEITADGIKARQTMDDDYLTMGNIVLQKYAYDKDEYTVDAGTGVADFDVSKRLAGAKFEVRAVNDIVSPDSTGNTAKMIKRADSGAVVAIITTGTDGIARIGAANGNYATFYNDKGVPEQLEKLYLGQYTVKEIQAPPGYEKDPRTFVVNLTTQYPTDTLVVKPVVSDDTTNVPENSRDPFDVPTVVNVELTKEDALTKQVIAGAVIELYTENDELIYTGTTDKDGHIRVTGIPAGRYYFLEKSVNDNYLINPNKIWVEASSSKNNTLVKVTMEDTRTPKGNINLLKTAKDKDGYELDKNGNITWGDVIPFAGAKFEVVAAADIKTPKYSSGGTSTDTILRAYAGTVVATITTGADGKARIEFKDNNYATFYNKSGIPEQTEFLYPGNYTVKEISAPYGYELDPRTFNVTITANYTVVIAPDVNVISSDVATAPWTVANPFDMPYTTKIVLDKSDVSSEAAIPNCTFEIYDSNDKLIGTYKTDANGKITINELPVGTYYFLEKDAPEEYMLNPDKHYFTVTPKKDSSGKPEIITCPVTDERIIMGNINLEKTGYDKDDFYVAPDGTTVYPATIPIQNAVFTVVAADDIYTPIYSGASSTMRLRARKDELIATITTGSTGKASVTQAKFRDNNGNWKYINMLYPGRYIIKELTPPDGYEPDPRTFIVTISTMESVGGADIIKDVINGNETIYPWNSTTKPFDKPSWGDVKISKIDISTDAPIPNTVIEIYKVNEDGGADDLIYTGITNSKGEFEVTKLPFGKYYLLEKEAPDEYMINPEPQPFEIDKDGEIKKATIKDVRIPMGNILLEKTGFDKDDFDVDENGETQYITVPIPNATFEVRAKKDITTPVYSDVSRTESTLRASAGDLIATITTNISGRATVTRARFMDKAGVWKNYSNLFGGEYTIVETIAPEGYELDPRDYTVIIDGRFIIDGDLVGNDIKIVNVHTDNTATYPYTTVHPFNKPTWGDVKIDKTDLSTQEPIPNTIIELYEDVQPPKFLFSGRTDENGHIDIIKLPAGEYFLLEKDAPDEYMLNPEPQRFKITKDLQIIPSEILDELLPKGNLDLIKKALDKDNYDVDEEGNTHYDTIPLAGAVFEVRAAEDIKTPVYSGGTRPETRLRATKGSLVATITTNSAGRGKVSTATFFDKEGNVVQLPYLYMGEYVVKEVSAPAGYELDPREYYITIVDDRGDPDLLPEIIFESVLTDDVREYPYDVDHPFNKPTWGDVKVTKKDFSTQDPIPNTILELYKDLGDDETGELLFRGRTNDKGEIDLQELPAGKYYFLEKDAPDEYMLNPDRQKFEITEDGDVIKSVIIDHLLPMGNLDLQKIGWNKDKYTVGADGQTTYEVIPLEGATFEVRAADDIKTPVYYGGNKPETRLRANKGDLIATLVTDAEGKATVTAANFLDKEGNAVVLENLYVGKYSIKETIAPEGYALDPREFIVEVTGVDGDEHAIDVKHVITSETEQYPYNNENPLNRPKWGEVDLSKTDVSTSAPVPGATIELYQAETNKLISTHVTDANGKIKIKDLPFGDYYFLEKDAPEGYLLNPERHYFEVKEDGEIVPCEMNDERLVMGNINLAKTGYDKGSYKINTNGETIYAIIPIPGATFSVTAAADIRVPKYSGDRPELYVAAKKGAMVATLTTDANGQATVKRATYTDADGKVEIVSALYQGEYYVKEIFAPYGYELDPRTFYVKVQVDGSTRILEVDYVPAEEEVSSEDSDDVVRGEVDTTETVSDTTEAIVAEEDADAAPALNRAPAADENPESVYVDADEINSKTLNKDGVDAEDLPDEKVLPPRKRLIFYSSIVSDEKYIGDVKTPFDRPTWGTSELTKRDISTSAPLPKTTITLYDVDGKQLYTGVTDKNGKITITKLPTGRYFFIESNPPKGYLLNPDKHWFEITKDGEIVKSVMNDEKDSTVTPPPPPGKGVNTGDPFSGYASVALLLVSGAFCILALKKKKREDSVA